MTRSPKSDHASAVPQVSTLVEQAAAKWQPNAPQQDAPPNSIQKSPSHPSRRATDKRPETFSSAAVHHLAPALAARHALLLPDAPASAQTEVFRGAKRPLLRQAFDGSAANSDWRVRVILVASAHAEEGKTHCALNLALSMCSDRALDIVLVDADSIKAGVSARLALPKSPGLMGALRAGAPPEPYVVKTNISNFSVLPAGRAARDDAELLGSAAMGQCLQRMLAGTPNRIIICDTAPLLASAAAPALAAHCGQIVMVVRADQTTQDDLASALAMLNGATRPHLLLNRVRFQSNRRRYDHYLQVEAEA